MYTHFRSLSHVVAFLHAAMLASLILLLCGPHLSLSLSLSLSSHTHPFYYLLLWTPPPSLSLSLSLSLFSHTHPLYSLLLGLQPLCVYLPATLTVTLLTRTLPPSLSISLSLSLQPIMICRTEVSIFPIAAVLKHKVSSAHGPPLGYGPYLHP